jgi:hypothetical protein
MLAVLVGGQEGSGSFTLLGICPVGGALGVLCVGTRYGGIHLPTFLIIFLQNIIRNNTSPKRVAIV